MVQTGVTKMIQSLDDFEPQFVARRSDNLNFSGNGQRIYRC
jgi:predicted component of type VI protein secretion system